MVLACVVVVQRPCCRHRPGASGALCPCPLCSVCTLQGPFSLPTSLRGAYLLRARSLGSPRPLTVGAVQRSLRRPLWFRCTTCCTQRGPGWALPSVPAGQADPQTRGLVHGGSGCVAGAELGGGCGVRAGRAPALPGLPFFRLPVGLPQGRQGGILGGQCLVCVCPGGWSRGQGACSGRHVGGVL